MNYESLLFISLVVHSWILLIVNVKRFKAITISGWTKHGDRFCDMIPFFQLKCYRLHFLVEVSIAVKRFENGSACTAPNAIFSTLQGTQS